MFESRNLLERVRRQSGVILAAPAVAAALVVGGVSSGVLAQDDASPARPAHIHSGSCGEEELGEVVAPLTELTGGVGGAAAALGNAQAVTAESSFTSVPLPLDTILAADHAINVHLSADEIEQYIACGEIGGELNANGNLVIGLQELNDSNFTGIAFLAAGADGVSTDVSVFIAEDLAEDEADGNMMATPDALGGMATPEATPNVGGMASPEPTADMAGMATPAMGGMATPDMGGVATPGTTDDDEDEDATATAEAGG